MDKKRLIIISIFVVIIMIGLIIIENSIRGIGVLVKKNKENIKIEEEKNQYENSEIYMEEVKLKTVIDDLIKLFKNNDKDALYALLDEEYKDYKFQNQKEEFEKYIEKYVNKDSEIDLQTYEKISGKYICRLLSEYDGNITSFVVLIEEKEDGSYNIIFDNITGISKESKVAIGNKDIKCNIIYEVTASRTLSYTIEFENITNKNISYTFEEIELKDTYKNYFNTEIDKLEISLKPGEKIRKDILFYDNKIHDYPKTMLKFNPQKGVQNENSLIFWLENSMGL